MRFHYISPSLLPSRSANSVHVILQCNGLAQVGVQLTLYAKRTISNASELSSALKSAYGVDTSRWRLISFYSNLKIAETFRIGLMAVMRIIFMPSEDYVLTRNLYAAWALAMLRRPFLFETHQLEYGLRKSMQCFIMNRPRIRAVVISDSLLNCLEAHHKIRLRNPLVLHDAASDGIVRLVPCQRRNILAGLVGAAISELEKWKGVCGYFGQLYIGRGIEIIEAMAAARPQCLFLVYGGSETEVAQRRQTAKPNLCFMGHAPHPIAKKVMQSVDVLLMPYQKSVSIGISGHDTARWMSPMKMFEYMATGVPIISSDLPVLREVLQDEKNALLVPPDKSDSWVTALDRLLSDKKFADSIGICAHNDYKRKHTWSQRALRLIEAAKEL